MMGKTLKLQGLENRPILRDIKEQALTTSLSDIEVSLSQGTYQCCQVLWFWKEPSVPDCLVWVKNQFSLIYIVSNKSKFLHKYVMHVAEEWGIINAGDNWEGMQLKKLNLHSQWNKPIYFYPFGKGWYAFQGKANVNLPMLKSVLGNSHFFFRFVDFYFLCLYVRIRLVLDFFFKIGGLQEPSQIIF